MARRRGPGVVLGLVVGAAWLPSGCKSSPEAALSQDCLLNSDCNSPLVCVFSRCHSQCRDSRDCTAGERCVASTSGGVCQLASESTCGPATLCQTGEVCGTDGQCRLACSGSGSCVPGDVCVASGTAPACYAPTNASDQPTLIADGVLSPDGSVLEDASAVSATPDSSTSSAEANADDGAAPEASSSDAMTASDTEAADADATVVYTNPCLSPETQFGDIAQGDSNPSFTSGVGLRTSAGMFIFSSSSSPASDAAADAGSVNTVYVQAFDLAANRLGPSQPLFSAPGGTGFVLETAAVAPTGQIALTFNYGGGYTFEGGSAQQNGLYAAFVGASAAADASVAGLSLIGITELATGQISGQPHVVWSADSGAFVFSWTYLASGAWLIGSKNTLPTGQSAGGDNPVPTDDGVSSVHDNAFQNESGSMTTGGGLLGMAFQSDTNLWPKLSILDLDGNLLGSPLPIENLNNSSGWQTVGGIAGGFVYLYSNNNAVSEVFIPTVADAGAAPQGDAGFSGFTFPGPVAVDGHAISDDPSGAGGVGVALLYGTSLSFAYVKSDGISHVGPSSIIAHAYAGGDVMNISSYHGSFALSLYSAAAQSTQMAISGCP